MTDLLLSFDAPPTNGFASSLPMFAIMGVIAYFLLYRPHQKEVKEHTTLVAGLQKGDRVVTNSGLHGKVHEAKGDTLVLEISANAFLTVDREAIKRKEAGT